MCKTLLDSAARRSPTMAVWSDFCAVAPSPQLRERLKAELAQAKASVVPIRLAQHVLDVVSAFRRSVATMACRTSRVAWRSFRLGSRPTRRVGTTSWPAAGRRGSVARHAVTPAATFWQLVICCSAGRAGAKPRSRPAPSWTAPGCLCRSGSPPPISSPPTRQGSRRCSCSANSGSRATKPPGRCCTSCGAPWCGSSATGSRARSSWTRPMSVASRKDGAAAGSVTAKR